MLRTPMGLGIALMIVLISAGGLGADEREAVDEREAFDEREREIDALRERASELIREAKTRFGKPDEARELAAEAGKLRQRAGQIERELHDARRGEERERLEARVEELRRHSDELREQGRAEEAERVLREIQELSQGLRRTGERPAPQTGRADSKETMLRLHHLRVAADNLHAAGLHPLAREVEEQAERLEREHHAPGHPDHPRPHPHGAPPLEGELHEVRAQMQRMQGQMNELREIVEQLRKRVEDR